MPLTKEIMKTKIHKKNIVILNVLPEEEFLKLRIKGSNNLPLTQDHDAFVAEVDKRYGKNFEFITHSADSGCAAGMHAAIALKKNGFKADYYPGGVREWDESGLPTEGLRPRPGRPERF
jgi:rhodanese-related sulfurtransferase